MFQMIIIIVLIIGGLIGKGYFGKDIKEKKAKLLEINNRLNTTSADNDNTYTGVLGMRVRENLEKERDWLNGSIAATKRISMLAPMIGIALAVILLIFSVVVVVPTGYTGIKTTFGKVEDVTLSSGINFKLPWQDVINMDNREQRSEFTLEAFSKDIQQVDIRGSINVNIDKTTAMNLYKDVGIEYPTILIGPRVQEDVKIVIALYTADNLIENRQKCSDAIYELLKDELSEKGINVISFAIENIDFTDAFESAVEAKQVATQEKLKAQTEQERQTMEMQQKAERDRIQAQAAADVQKIDADAKAYAVKVEADAQAEANKKISETLSDRLIYYNLIHQWNGELPAVFGSDGLFNVINLKGLTEDTVN